MDDLEELEKAGLVRLIQKAVMRVGTKGVARKLGISRPCVEEWLKGDRLPQKCMWKTLVEGLKEL
jgi:predicted DNA-binding transcriptional regulator AlpA